MKNPYRLAAAVAAAFALAAAVAVPASAVEQSSYSQTTNSTSCSAGYVSGYVNYCRNTDPKRINYTGGRDGDLRSQSGGLYQDKYSDNYIIGNLNGATAYTLAGRNNFSSTSIKTWTGTCYSGASTLVTPGNSMYPSSSTNLRSMAASTVTACA